ncbi:MFS transporter [Streptomyces sulfonofaciens]|uniref:MFS transporter n=1 Tax=Streptomyces sulfonofaciens TaxID=68272 RepID=A0A919G2Y3_9ACTN|nr:MFS transporter [Streptomyces sulfonofaciens]GHH76623.1 MFS transporter [Streptomyces sulfonofaciens]
MARPVRTTRRPAPGPVQKATGDTASAVPPPVPRPGATLALTSAATAVALMTYTAPMVTLSDTAASLGSPLSAQAWLLNGAPLGLSALLLVAGSLADDYGRRRIFLFGTLALGVTTALGALASDTWLFVLARVAQGAASAAVLASSLGLLVHAFPGAHSRIRATGVWGAFVSGGIATGPLLAGGLATVDWRWAYVVLGLAALLVAVLGRGALTESRAPRPSRPDLAGSIALGLALVALLAALTLGRDGWARPSVVLLLLASVLLAAAFAVVERRSSAPMLDLGLLRRPLFLAASSGALFTGLAVIGPYSFLPTLLQGTLGLTPLDTAWLFLIWAGTSFVVALQSRRLLQSPRLAGRISARHQLALGFVLHAAGMLAMLGAAGAGSWTRLLPGLFVTGAGSGLLNAGLPLLAVESVPADRAAMGSGANNTARYIGSSAGVALTIAVATAMGTGSRGGTAALAHGTDVALVVSAGLSALAAAGMLLLRERGRAAGPVG